MANRPKNECSVERTVDAVRLLMGFSIGEERLSGLMMGGCIDQPSYKADLPVLSSLRQDDLKVSNER